MLSPSGLVVPYVPPHGRAAIVSKANTRATIARALTQRYLGGNICSLLHAAVAAAGIEGGCSSFRRLRSIRVLDTELFLRHATVSKFKVRNIECRQLDFCTSKT